MYTATLLLALLCARTEGAAQEEKLLTVPKCCAKGQQLHKTGVTCVARPGFEVEAVEEEELRPGDPSAYWLPHSLRDRPLMAIYNSSHWDRLWLHIVTALQEEDFLSIIENVHRNDRKKRSPEISLAKEFVRGSWTCFDVTDRVETQFMMIHTLAMRPVAKCCGRAERLNAQLTDCEADPDVAPGAQQQLQQQGKEEEILHTARDPLAGRWLPLRYQGSVVRVRYGERRRFNWTLSVDADVEGAWRVLPAPAAAEELRVEVRDAQGDMRRAPLKCFDAAAPTGRRVVLALVLDLFKCCDKGEQFNEFLTECVPRPGWTVEGTLSEVLDTASNASYWLPSRIRSPSARFSVCYGCVNTSEVGYVIRAEQDARWTLGYHQPSDLKVLVVKNEPPKLNYTLLNICFEAVESGPLAPRVILAMPNNKEQMIGTKCCLAGQALSPDGRCESYDGVHWSPLDSAVAPLLSPLPRFSRYGVRSPYCSESSFTPQRTASPSEFLRLLNASAMHPDSNVTFYCADLQRGADGAIHETLASCSTPPSAPVHNAERPLHEVSAVLLAAAVATVLARGSTRSSD